VLLHDLELSGNQTIGWIADYATLGIMKSLFTILFATLAAVAFASTPNLPDSSDVTHETEVAQSILERADVNRDSCLDTEDLMIVLGSFGISDGADADINCDNRVDQRDAFLILHLYATQCEGF
jgi:hypothetical protein